jgi:pyruvate dehydrogenase E1 component alpha subunit
MYLIRAAEDAIVARYHENDMKSPMHMTAGAEAISAAVCLAIGDDSLCLSSYRSHGPYLARTLETDRFFAEMYGKRGGTADGRAGSMHLSAPAHGYLGASAIVASVIPVATGAAFSLKRQGKQGVVAVFFGDGAIDEGNFWESINLACALRLPVLFVCEDNGFAVHTPAHVRHGYASITDIVSRFNISAAETETTNASELHDVTGRLLDDMRAHGRPGFVRMQYCRYLEHVGVNEDFSAGYRSRAEAKRWMAVDPVTTHRRRLRDAGISEDWIAQLEHSIRAQIAHSIDLAMAAACPDDSVLFKDVMSHENAYIS